MNNKCDRCHTESDKLYHLTIYGRICGEFCPKCHTDLFFRDETNKEEIGINRWKHIAHNQDTSI